MRNKLFGAAWITPLVESEPDWYGEQKGDMIADLIEDELDAMSELDMKSKLKEFMWDDFDKFDDEILDENWQMLAKSWGLELKWTEKEPTIEEVVEKYAEELRAEGQDVETMIVDQEDIKNLMENKNET